MPVSKGGMTYAQVLAQQAALGVKVESALKSIETLEKKTDDLRQICAGRCAVQIQMKEKLEEVTRDLGVAEESIRVYSQQLGEIHAEVETLGTDLRDKASAETARSAHHRLSEHRKCIDKKADKDQLKVVYSVIWWSLASIATAIVGYVLYHIFENHIT